MDFSLEVLVQATNVFSSCQSQLYILISEGLYFGKKSNVIMMMNSKQNEEINRSFRLENVFSALASNINSIGKQNYICTH